MDDIPVPKAPVATSTCTDLALTVDLETPEVRPGGDVRGSVTVTNTGTSRVDILTVRTLTGVLLDAEDRVVGSATGWQSMAGYTHELEPGRSTTLPFRCSALAQREPVSFGQPIVLTPTSPGTYRLVVSVPAGVSQAEGALLTQPVEVTVTRC